MADEKAIPLPSLAEIEKEIVAKKIDWSYWLGWGKSVLIWALMSAGSAGATYAAMRSPADPAPVPDPISIASDFTGNPMEPFTIRCETAGTLVRWRVVDPGLVLMPDPTTKKPVCIACKQAVYRVECWTAVNGVPTEIYRTTVTIGSPPPAPLPPGPTPPPDPPKPVPPPAPTDPLTVKLQAAVDADTKFSKGTKAALIVDFIGVYEAMISHTKGADILTTGALLADYQKVAEKLAPGVLMGMRQILADEVGAALGSNADAALDAAMRDKAVALWARLAKALGGVK